MNKFYTLMIIPEKTSHVRKIVVPRWALRAAGAGVGFFGLLAAIMFFDYWYVMNQISENKQLKIENRRYRQQVQIYKDKFNTIENTMDRVKTFATRLKVITNIEDHGNLLQTLNRTPLPDAASNVGSTRTVTHNLSGGNPGDPAAERQLASPSHPSGPPGAPTELKADAKPDSPRDPARLDTTSTHSPNGLSPSPANGRSVSSSEDDETLLATDLAQLNERFGSLAQESTFLEQVLHDEYELLADKKAFLSARPTRRPSPGYYTSGFGVRKSPFGGRIKMHEGIDIANAVGTPIKATADGVVVFGGIKAGYGNTVIVDHGYGLETWYGHTRKVLVTPGQKIKRGDEIALLGNTGHSTGPHVHYEVRVHGTPVDPLSYILED